MHVILRKHNRVARADRAEEKVRPTVREIATVGRGIRGRGDRDDGRNTVCRRCCAVQTLSRSKQIRLSGRWLHHCVASPKKKRSHDIIALSFPSQQADL